MQENTVTALADGGPDDAAHREHPLSQGIGERFGSVCAGMSLNELVELTGFSKETVRRQLLQGRPTLDFIAAVCDALDLSADWVLCGRGEPHEECSAVDSDPDQD